MSVAEFENIAGAVGSRNEKKVKENALGYPAAHQASLVSSSSFYSPQRDPGTSSIRSGQLDSGLCKRAAFRGPIDHFLERNASVRSRLRNQTRLRNEICIFYVRIFAKASSRVIIIRLFLFVFFFFLYLVNLVY